MNGSAAPLRVLTVCSHNRTRSVMTATMLQASLDERLGAGAAQVRSLGFGPEGLPSIPDAVEAMRRRGFDTSGHRSRQVTRELLDPFDLVLTAERDHVIKIATISPPVFRRSMTLPEFLDLAEWDDPPPGAGVREWAASLTASRTARDYLTADVAEIDDPTGWSPRAFEAAVVEMESQCRRAAELIQRVQ